MAEEENPGNNNGVPPAQDPSQNPASPYYLHPGENPGVVLVAPPLNDTNYYNWSKAMRRALTSKKKLKFINGDLLQLAETDPLFEAWETCNNIVVSWINRSLSTRIQQSTISIDNAHELWLDLKQRFTKGNYYRMSNLLQDLHSMKQGDRTLTNYFTDMKIIWDELEHLRPTCSCSCATVCTYSLSKAVKQFKDLEYVICFLKGLNESYSNVRTQILLMNPLSSINEALALATQQEIPPHQSVTDLAAFSAGTSTPDKSSNSLERGRGKPNSKTPMLCTHCKKTNHTVENCYFKHGFPPGYRTRNQSATMQASADTATSAFRPAASHSGNTSEHSLPLSRDDYNHLLQLLHSSKIDSSTSSFSGNKQSHQESSSSNFISSINNTGKL